jgi:hypothetical protein
LVLPHEPDFKCLHGFSGRFSTQNSLWASNKKNAGYSDAFIFPQANDCPIKSYSEPYVSVQMRPLVLNGSRSSAWAIVVTRLQATMRPTVRLLIDITLPPAPAGGLVASHGGPVGPTTRPMAHASGHSLDIIPSSRFDR